MKSNDRRCRIWQSAGSLFVLLLFTQIACSFSGAIAPGTPTITPEQPTIVIASPTAEPTLTAMPSHTPKPTVTRTPDQTATIEALREAEHEKWKAEIAPDLKAMGLPADSGSLVWHDSGPVPLKLSAYQEDRIKPISNEKFTNFVIQSEIKWNSSTGFAGCGLAFRAEEDLKMGAHYLFQTLRLQNAPAWDVELWKYDQWAATVSNGKAHVTPAIKDYQDSVNKIALVVYEDEITPFINGEQQITFKSDLLKEGLIGYFAFQDSGKTTCTFSRTWVWALKDGKFKGNT